MNCEYRRSDRGVTAGLSALLLDWRSQCPYNQSADYVFASAEKKGHQPLWPSSAMSKHIRPAATRAGIPKHVGWHVFRPSFATLPRGKGEDVTRVQQSLRHANSKVTLDVHTQGLMPPKRGRDDRCKCLIAKDGRVAQVVEQCPFNVWMHGNSTTCTPWEPPQVVARPLNFLRMWNGLWNDHESTERGALWESGISPWDSQVISLFQRCLLTSPTARKWRQSLSV